ncbi:MAG: cell wall hydrolase [Desulfobacteraceae bacterium]|jgi:spore germination cell wall hydrolase CwlJ-like protein
MIPTLVEAVFWVSLSVYHEAQGEPWEGKKGVAHVIFTRVSNRDLSAKEVVLQRYQFSWANTNSAKLKSKIWHKTFVDCLNATLEAIAERAAGKDFHRADHYYAFQGRNKIEAPSWSKRMKLVKDVGNHRFLRARNEKGGLY